MTSARVTPAAVRAAEATAVAEWLIDAIADELTAQPALDRHALLARLRIRAGYEQAGAEVDPAAASANARRALALGVAARLDDAAR